MHNTNIAAESLVDAAIESGLLRPGLRTWAIGVGHGSIATLKATLLAHAEERGLPLPLALKEELARPEPPRG